MKRVVAGIFAAALAMSATSALAQAKPPLKLGGILVALAEKHKLPVHFIGVGEGIDDLAAFTARDFAQAIAGIE